MLSTLPNALQDMVQMCDDTLAEAAGINSATADKLPVYLQVSLP